VALWGFKPRLPSAVTRQLGTSASQGKEREYKASETQLSAFWFCLCFALVLIFFFLSFGAGD
jgi:hypothetical protein